MTTKTKLNIRNWRKLRKHVAGQYVAIDQDTFGDQLKRVNRLRVNSLDCGTPGCLAFHAVAACAPKRKLVDYAAIRGLAKQLLGIEGYPEFFRARAGGWPDDLLKIYNTVPYDGIHRKLAMLELIDRVIFHKRLTNLDPIHQKET
jgi:hypothetical protein